MEVNLLEREGPLAALDTAREQAAEGLGSVVLVTGEPGIGKTALLESFVRRHREDTRVLWGSCDDLAIPRPLGPFRDLDVSGILDEDIDHEPHRFHGRLLEELAAPPRPSVLVLEDIHWADQATIDAITVVGRRIAALPAVMVLSFRTGESDPGHHLPRALETIRSNTSLYLQLAPLSRSAVTSLAGINSDRVYSATGGNPFFVTEMVAALPAELPESVATAVQGRASRLTDESVRLIEMVSMVPSRVSIRVLDVAMPNWASVADEPERRKLLTVEPQHVRFRHELARLAIRSGVPIARQRRLHTEILRALLTTEADPADVVHHAEAAGDTETVAAYAMTAARRAVAAESNREAFAHFARAAQFADRFSVNERAELFEEFAVTAYTMDRLPEAFSAIERGIELNREIGDQLGVGRCTWILSRCHWYAGNGEAAAQEAEAAVKILEPLGQSVELARAYSGLSQLAMLANDNNAAVEWGERAVDLAERLGADAIKAHALINIGSVRMQSDPDGFDLLLTAHRLADETGERHEAVRALLNLGYSALAWVNPATARPYTEQAVAYAEEYQVDALLHYARVMSAWLDLREGNWAAAGETAGVVATTGTSVAQLLAKTVLTELSVRRGDPDAHELLADLSQQAEGTAELQRIGPVLQLETEMALTSGADLPMDRFERVRSLIEPSSGWVAASVAAWGSVAGLDMGVEVDVPGPYAAMVEGDWARAADTFGEVGWVYDQALMLSLLEDETSLDSALGIARRLGARPLEQSLVQRMRELRMTVPPRPRQTTLANQSGLTPRQVDVLELLGEGLTNGEIAERLYISVRTVEHHVEAIFAKLGVSDRRAAAAEARALSASADGD